MPHLFPPNSHHYRSASEEHGIDIILLFGCSQLFHDGDATHSSDTGSGIE